jgi:phosphate transport system protein
VAEAQIADAIDALVRRDGDAAMAIVSRDVELDRMETEAERMAVQMIAVRSPLADDLREIIAALKISAVIERIGDYAKNIAKRVPVLTQTAPVGPSVIIPEMARAAAGMVRDALDAFVDRDATLALEVMERDQRVDDLYNSLFRTLLTYMMENPHHITSSAHLLFIAKNLERVGDHATNIAEMVHFSVTGEHLADRPKTDATATISAEQGD